jgi:cell division protein FtsB
MAQPSEKSEAPEVENDRGKKASGEDRWRKILDSALTTVIVALVIGFFASVWRASSTIDEKLADLNKKADESARALRATTDVLTAEMARIQVQNYQARIDELEKELAAQHEEIKKLRDFVAGGPASASRQPPALAPPKSSTGFSSAELLKRSQEEESRLNMAIQQKRH